MTLHVLCVAPRFAPANAADSHRLRLLLAHAEASGWTAEVLTVDPADVGVPVDDFLSASLPAGLPVHRVRTSLSARPFATLALRAAPQLWQAGNRLLASGRFDLVFFSTTEFLVHLLGVVWQRRHGVPFCMDFQDPWVSDYYRQHPEVVPPGGRFKYGVMSWLDRLAEARVVAACAGFLAVSASYVDDLRCRYGAAVAGKPVLVRGFPAEPAELVRAGSDSVADAGVWRYIGRGGTDLHQALSGFLGAWRLAAGEPAMLPEALRVEALGTSYASGARARLTLQPLAERAGLGECFHEQPARLAYSRMLSLLQSSGALLVFGSDDPAYTASKIYPYLLAGRPLLLICHAESPLVALIAQVGGAVCVTFRPGQAPAQLAEDILAQWFRAQAWRQPRALDMTAFAAFTAATQAGEVAGWMQACVQQAGGRA